MQSLFEGTAYMEDPKSKSGDVSSDEQEEMKDFKENDYELVNLAEATQAIDKAVSNNDRVLICDNNDSRALTKIIFGDDLNEIGKVEAKVDKETNKVIDIFYTKG